MSNNYVPRNDNQFIDWAQTILDHSEEHHERWGVMAPSDELKELLKDFTMKLVRYTAPNSGPVDTMVKNEARSLAEKGFRVYVQGFLAKNPNVTLADRGIMKLPVYDVTPTNIPPPAIPVTGILTFPAVGLVEMRNMQPAGDKRDERSKHGVRIYYGVLGGNVKAIPARPATGDDLPHSVFTRKSRYRFDFTGESGKEVFFCMRYENSKGEAGPWGKIISSHIP